MMKITFVSNTDIINPKGGWDGLGNNIFNQLSLQFEMNLIDKINPRVSIFNRIRNKVKKELGRERDFYFFSNGRLQSIAKIISQRIDKTSQMIVFHGSTPWVKCDLINPYVIYTDCTFNSYLDIYHDRGCFCKNDVQRIENLERDFLLKSQGIYFTSQFALIESQKYYGLPKEKLFYISQGPSIKIGEGKIDFFQKKKQFLFIATDFLGKGGVDIYNSFCEFCKGNSDFQLVIVGQKPPAWILKNPQINYIGFIDKSSVAGLQSLKKIYSESHFLIILSTRDVLPLSIVEAGYLGCPTIALNFAAISEMIDDQRTGYIIKNKNQLLDTLIKTTSLSRSDYFDICKNAQVKMINEFNWDLTVTGFGDIIPK